MTHEDDLFERLREEEAQAAYTEEEEFGAEVDRVAQPKPDLGPEWERDTSLDITEVRLDDPELRLVAPREPDWVIRGDCVEQELHVIKTGKEADVTLVRRTSGTRACLLARKRYRPRAQRAFRREEDYRDGQGFGDERVDRAVRKRSAYGRSILEYAWAYREMPLMRLAWEAGVLVPFPVESAGEALYMQYLGDEHTAAPRLAEVRLDTGEARRVFDDLVESMRRLLEVYIVHADLSPYNVLYWKGRPWLIDFPQAVDVARSSRGLEFLRRDCVNVCRWFHRMGVGCDAETLYHELLNDAPFGASLQRDACADMDVAAATAHRRAYEAATGGPRRGRRTGR